MTKSVTALLFVLALPAGCTRSSGSDAVTTGPVPNVPADHPLPTGGGAPATATGSGSRAPGLTTAPAPPPSAPPPETGVPGIDSADAFCAAWSRYAGSFQVVAVASNFLSSEPQRAFELELAAAGVVVESYAALLDHWPDQLAGERAVAEQVFGPFAARAADTAAALTDAGATPADVAEISEAWLAALAMRNPEQPDVDVPVDAARAALLAQAAEVMYNTRGPLHSDPTLVSEAEPAATYEYLAANCPDRGLLAGGEVG